MDLSIAVQVQRATAFLPIVLLPGSSLTALCHSQLPCRDLPHSTPGQIGTRPMQSAGHLLAVSWLRDSAVRCSPLQMHKEGNVSCGRRQGPGLVLALILAPSVHIAQIPGSASSKSGGRSAPRPLTIIETPRRRPPGRKAGARGRVTGWPIARSSSSILPLGNTCILPRASPRPPGTTTEGRPPSPAATFETRSATTASPPSGFPTDCFVPCRRVAIARSRLGGSGLLVGWGPCPCKTTSIPPGTRWILPPLLCWLNPLSERLLEIPTESLPIDTCHALFGALTPDSTLSIGSATTFSSLSGLSDLGIVIDAPRLLKQGGSLETGNPGGKSTRRRLHTGSPILASPIIATDHEGRTSSQDH
jgi:hypothetical protein